MNPQDNPPAGSSGVPPEPQAPPQPQVFGPQQSTPSSSFNPQPPAPSGPYGPPQPPLPPATPQGYPQQPGPPGPIASGSMPPMPPGPAYPSYGPPPKKRPGKKLLAIVAAVLILGLGGGVFAYVQIMNNSSEKVLADALTGTMADVLDRKPSQAVGTIKIESKDADRPVKLTIDLDAKLVADNSQIGAKVDLTMETMQISLSGTAIVQGSEAVYFKLDNLGKTVDQIIAEEREYASLKTRYQPIIDKLDGKWIKIDKNSLAELGFDTSKEEIDKCSQALENLRISKDDQKKIKHSFTTHQFAIASEELPAETVDGDKSFHYKLDLNEEAGLHFAKELVELPSFAGVKKDCEIEQKDLDKALEDLKKDVKEQTDKEVDTKPVFELWASKKTHRPTKFKITLDDKEVSMENITMVKINASNISIDIPKESTSISELAKSFEEAYSEAPGNALGWTDIREDVLNR